MDGVKYYYAAHIMNSFVSCLMMASCEAETYFIKPYDIQDRQCTHNVILRRVRAAIVAVEKQ
jgi:hypothetical protein